MAPGMVGGGGGGTLAVPATASPTQDVEGFLRFNEIDESTCQQLKACSPELQRMVMERGNFDNCWNPSAVLRSRIKNLQASEGLLGDQTYVKFCGFVYEAKKEDVVQFLAPEF